MITEIRPGISPEIGRVPLDEISMSRRSIDMSIHLRGNRLAEIDASLRTLNEQFPGEKKKPGSQRDPEFVSARSALINEKKILASQQKMTRTVVREMIG